MVEKSLFASVLAAAPRQRYWKRRHLSGEKKLDHNSVIDLQNHDLVVPDIAPLKFALQDLLFQSCDIQVVTRALLPLRGSRTGSTDLRSQSPTKAQRPDAVV